MTETNGLWDKIARENGYMNKLDLLMDYNIQPTVRVPSHKAIEVVPLVVKHFSKSKRRKQHGEK